MPYVMKIYRVEWQILRRELDQYNRPVRDSEKCLASFSTMEQAVQELPNYANKHAFVPDRWMPKDDVYGYSIVDIAMREVLVSVREE